MSLSELKLYTKRKISGKYIRYTAVSLFPFLIILLLSVSDYYFFVLLKNTEFNISIQGYRIDNIIRISVILLSLVLSLFILQSASLVKEKFFRSSTGRAEASFFKCIKALTAKQYLRFSAVSTIVFLLKISWSALYLSPCVLVTALLIYGYRYENYGFNVNLTLFVSSVLLFITGVLFLFVTLKRYALCSQIILNNEEKNPLKIIEKSILNMENRCVPYSLYCLSFSGWVVCCVFLLPVFYVLPYLNTGKWYYLNSTEKKRFFKHSSEKPIIFYFSTSIKKVGN